MTFYLKPHDYYEASNLSGMSELLVQLQNVSSLSKGSMDKLSDILVSALNQAYENPERAEAPPHQIELLIQSIDRGPEAFMSTLRRLIASEQSLSGLDGSLGNLFTKIGSAIAKVADKVKPLVEKGKQVVAVAKPLITQLQQQPVSPQYMAQASEAISYQTPSPSLPVEKPNKTLLYIGLGVGGLLLLSGVLYFATRPRPVSGINGTMQELPSEAPETTEALN